MASFDSRLLDFLPDPVLILDAARGIASANRAARDLLGKDITGRDLSLALRNPDVLAATDAVLAGDSAEQRTRFAIPVPVQRHFEACLYALPADLDGTGRAVVVLRDITDALGAEQMRADFVANVSHELRSPLSSLVGFVQTLREAAKDDAEARERFLDIMDAEAARMTRLIDDLLSLSRVESTEHVPPSGRADVLRLARGVAESLSMRAADRGMKIAIHCPEPKAEVIGEPDELTKVIHNLLDNAISYGAARSPVAVEIAAEDRIPITGRAGFSIAVHNEGEGIDSEHLPRLTERFYRVDKARSRSTGGTGLGLAIVKHIVNHHRGHITIRSAPDQGVTVTVFLPAAEDAQSEAGGAAAVTKP